jgi:hypothetical protein
MSVLAAPNGIKNNIPAGKEAKNTVNMLTTIRTTPAITE